MVNQRSKGNFAGILSALAAYLFWGILPIYWKLIAFVPAPEILAHRIIWSFIFMLCIIYVTKRSSRFYEEVRTIVNDRHKFRGVVFAAVLISINWLVYIWAVNANRIVEASFGYYINPLGNLVLGILVLKEKLTFWQTISFMLAGAGVLNMLLNFGVIPWVSLVLATSFALYGLTKKMINIGAITSITLETLLVSPVALIYLLYLQQQQSSSFSLTYSPTLLLLVGAGVVTAVPLLLFADGANKLPLTMMGFLQYLSPSLSLVVGVLIYGEPFTTVHLASFSCIWSALAIYSMADTKLFRTIQTSICTNITCLNRFAVDKKEI